MYTYIHTYIHTYIYIYIYVHIYIYIYNTCIKSMKEQYNTTNYNNFDNS